jgi:hypothetical protein
MIYPEDAKEFSTLMDVTWQSLGRNYVDKPTKQYWFGKLQKYALGDVATSFDRWILSSRELPTIDDIIKGCNRQNDFVKALPHIRDAEKDAEGLKKIESFIAKSIEPKKDHRAWARRILKTPQYFPSDSVKEAKIALGMTT